MPLTYPRSLFTRSFPIILLLMLWSTSSALFGRQAGGVPSTPAGQLVMQYLDAFNSGSDERMKEFFSANADPASLERRPIPERIDIYHQMKRDIGELRPRSTVGETDSSITLRATNTAGEWFEFAFMLNGARQLAGIRVERLEGEPSEAPVRPMSMKEFAGAVTDLVQTAADRDEFSGVVLVAKGSVPVASAMAGYANFRHRVPIASDTKFNLGSINKFFTKIAIAKLFDEKRLTLDDPVVRHLPDYPQRDVAERVTIRHLLTMTSGMGDFFGEKFDATPKDRIRSLQDYLPFFVEDSLTFAPGTDRAYSNAGYIVLGLIIEAITGADYYSYVRNTIIAPAGMTNTDWYAMDEETPNLATGYTLVGSRNGRRVPNFYTAPARGSSAGGGYSTAEDLLSLIHALKEFRIVSPAATSWLFGGPEPGGTAGNQTPLRGGIGIAGGAPGINAALDADGESNITVIVLSNYDPPAAEQIARQLRQMVRGLK